MPEIHWDMVSYRKKREIKSHLDIKYLFITILTFITKENHAKLKLD